MMDRRQIIRACINKAYTSRMRFCLYMCVRDKRYNNAYKKFAHTKLLYSTLRCWDE